MKDFYTTKEVAQIVGLKDNSIRKYVSLGQIKASKIGSTTIIYADDLKEWLANRAPRKKLTTLVNEVVNDDSLSDEEKSEKIEQLLKDQETRRINVGQ